MGQEFQITLMSSLPVFLAVHMRYFSNQITQKESSTALSPPNIVLRIHWERLCENICKSSKNDMSMKHNHACLEKVLLMKPDED